MRTHIMYCFIWTKNLSVNLLITFTENTTTHSVFCKWCIVFFYITVICVWFDSKKEIINCFLHGVKLSFSSLTVKLDSITNFLFRKKTILSSFCSMYLFLKFSILLLAVYKNCFWYKIVKQCKKSVGGTYKRCFFSVKLAFSLINSKVGQWVLPTVCLRKKVKSSIYCMLLI